MAVTLFTIKNYRSAIENLIKQKKDSGEKVTYSAIADEIGVQKAYFTNVMKGRADLNSDQMYLFCKSFSLDKVEARYLNLLLELERTGLSVRKAEIRDELESIREVKLKTKNHISAPQVKSETVLPIYLLSPYMQKVHFGLAIKKFKKNPKLLREELGLSQEKFSEILKGLEANGFVKRVRGEFVVQNQTWHLDKADPLYANWIHQERVLSTQRIHQISSRKHYSFNVTFTGDEDSKQQIESLFLSFLKKVEKIAKAAPTKQLYQLGFDLIPWTEP